MLFDIQGQTIHAIRAALDAVARTQQEMAKLIPGDTRMAGRDGLRT